MFNTCNGKQNFQDKTIQSSRNKNIAKQKEKKEKKITMKWVFFLINKQFEAK